MHNFRTNYDKILEVLDQVEPKYDRLKRKHISNLERMMEALNRVQKIEPRFGNHT